REAPLRIPARRLRIASGNARRHDFAVAKSPHACDDQVTGRVSRRSNTSSLKLRILLPAFVGPAFLSFPFFRRRSVMRRRGLTLVEVVVLIFLLVIVIGLMLPAVQRTPPSSTRTQT